MAVTYKCTFTLPPANAGSNSRLGGKFSSVAWTPQAGSGNGIYTPKHGTPILLVGDSIQIVVNPTGNNAPTSLTGTVMISASQDAPQSAPSPFVQNNNANAYLCLLPLGTVSLVSGVYTFPLTTYNNSNPGAYELTFVAQDATAGTQWSEDPEFDTGN